MNKKYRKDEYGLECTNDKNIAQQEIGLFEYDDIILYKEGQLTFCFTKDELPYLSNKNPWSTKPLSQEFKDYIKTLKEEPTNIIARIYLI